MNNTHPMTDADLIAGGYDATLYLNGYAHPLPAGLTTTGNLYLTNYAHPLPAGLTTTGYINLRDYSHPLPAGLTTTGNLNLRDYSHPLPAGLTTTGYIYLNGYAHPLPAGLATVHGVAVSAVPVIPHIDAAILAALMAGGKLDMYDWHTCGTTHCRAGWAIILAGDAGAELEREVGPSGAGTLIYAASRPGKPVPNFHASNAAVMSSIRADAAAEVALITPPASST